MRLKVADQVSASIGSGQPGAQVQALTAALGWGPAVGLPDQAEASKAYDPTISFE